MTTQESTIRQLKGTVEAERLYQFAESDERFKSLSPSLKNIAISIALEVSGIEERDLLYKAGEIDYLAMTDDFVRAEAEASGKLLETYFEARRKELKLHPNDYDEITRRGLSLLRQSIASRMSRLALAKELGYQPYQGLYPLIIMRSDFQAANDLCWQAVREFQAHRKK